MAASASLRNNRRIWIEYQSQMRSSSILKSSGSGRCASQAFKSSGVSIISKVARSLLIQKTSSRRQPQRKTFVPQQIEISCNVNDAQRTLQVYPMERLLDVLREQLRLTGTKEGCGEGVATGDQLHRVQQAFIECGGAQCGICTPGMVLAAVNLLEHTPNPTEAEIRNGLAGNLCRCTGYMKIFESVVRACQR